MLFVSFVGRNSFVILRGSAQAREGLGAFVEVVDVEAEALKDAEVEVAEAGVLLVDEVTSGLDLSTGTAGQ